MALQKSYFWALAKGGLDANSDIDIAVILKDYTNPVEIQPDSMRLRKKIDSRVEPHPFREKDFDMANPIVGDMLLSTDRR